MIISIWMDFAAVKGTVSHLSPVLWMCFTGLQMGSYAKDSLRRWVCGEMWSVPLPGSLIKRVRDANCESTMNSQGVELSLDFIFLSERPYDIHRSDRGQETFFNLTGIKISKQL